MIKEASLEKIQYLCAKYLTFSCEEKNNFKILLGIIHECFSPEMC